MKYQANITEGEKEDWIFALRSRKYKQGIGRLHEEDRFCSLGVFHDINGGHWANSVSEPGVFDAVFGEKRCAATLPDEWGIPPAVRSRISLMNDALRLTFGQIADWVEDNVEAVR